jgi:hypothetical protein
MLCCFHFLFLWEVSEKTIGIHHYCRKEYHQILFQVPADTMS